MICYKVPNEDFDFIRERAYKSILAKYENVYGFKSDHWKQFGLYYLATYSHAGKDSITDEIRRISRENG